MSFASHTNKCTPCILVARATKLSLRKLLSTHKNMMKVNFNNKKKKSISTENHQNYARVSVIIHNNLSWSDIFFGIDLYSRVPFLDAIYNFLWSFFSVKKFTEKMLRFNIAKLNLTNKMAWKQNLTRGRHMITE